jgi:RNA polymerase sigma-70 factor (ECF subfamily)
MDMNTALDRVPDGQLARVCLEGREDASQTLYLRYFPRVVRFAYRRVGDHSLAEDIAQEALVRALDHIESFDVSRPMWPWLKAIASNLIVDHVRRCSDEERCYARLGLPPPEGTTAEDEALSEALANLPVRQRIAIALRYLDDWDPTQVADFLGLNRNAVEQLLFRARRRLKAEYERTSQRTLGLILLPLRGSRHLRERVWERLRKVTDHPYAVAGTGLSESAGRLLGGFMAFLLALSSGGVGGAVSAGDSLWAGGKDGTRPRSLLRQDHAPRHPRYGANGPPTTSTGIPAVQGNGSGNSQDPVTWATDPNKGVRDPEDARITSIVVDPDHRGHAYAAGETKCGVRCPQVLFRSEDGGATWKRLPAAGFLGETLLVPARYFDEPKPLFAMGPSGLQVSRDGGESFETAAVVGASFTVGAAAISPAFSRGDPTILIGAQTLMQYRDDRRVIEPVPSNIVGPLYPLFSPDYPRDARIFVGGIKFDPVVGRPHPVVFTCADGGVCTESVLKAPADVPRLRAAPDFTRTGRLFAFTQRRLFVSTDSATTFAPFKKPDRARLLTDLAVVGGRVFVSTAGRPSSKGGLYHKSVDGGGGWHKVGHRLLSDGVLNIVSGNGLMFVALSDGGLLCSTDAGRTWYSRCPDPPTSRA